MNLIENNSLILCDASIKKQILEINTTSKVLRNLSFLNWTNLKEKLYFRITKRALLYMMEALNLSYSNASLFSEYLYMVDTKEVYKDQKLLDLQRVKKELFERDLLEEDPLFTAYLKKHKVYVYGNEFTPFQKQMIEVMKEYTSVIMVPSSIEEKEYFVSVFQNYQEEIDYTFSCIRQLLDAGTDINHIYLTNVDSSYHHLLRRYSYLYHIPVFIPEEESILSHAMTKAFLSYLEENMPMEDIFKKLSYYQNDFIYKSLIGLYNEFYFVTDRSVLTDILKTELQGIKYQSEALADCVQIAPFASSFSEDDIVFCLNFTNGSIPKNYIDDAYLGDKYASILPVTTSLQKNKLELNKAIYTLSSIPNIHLSYALMTAEKKIPSSLVRILNIKELKPNIPYGLSKDLDELKLGMYLDDFIHYNVANEMLSSLYNSFDYRYNSYQNQLDFIDKELLKEKLKSQIYLSYSSISTFYKCQFYYYLNYVLKIKTDDNKSAAHLGTAFHSILEHRGKVGFDLEQERETEFNQLESPMEKFYFNKLWPELERVLNFIDEMKEYSILGEELHEQNMDVDYSDASYVRHFIGFIDKILYTNIDGKEYCAIIDYKTGDQSSSLDNINLGFNLQLPVYAYLIAKTNVLKNPKILGIFLQHIINEPYIKKTEDIEEAKQKAIKLDGYAIDNPSELSLLDSTYAKSKMIKSMTLSKDGNFGKYAKVFSKENLEEIIALVEKLILDAFLSIENGEFQINPKYIDEENQSCTFCHYKDICYKRQNNKVNFKKQKFADTFGGE